MRDMAAPAASGGAGVIRREGVKDLIAKFDPPRRPPQAGGRSGSGAPSSGTNPNTSTSTNTNTTTTTEGGGSQMPEQQSGAPSVQASIDPDDFTRQLRANFDLIVELLEDRIISDLERRGGRFRGDF